MMVQPDWGVDLSQASVPVRLWHGTEDRLVDPSAAQVLKALIPGAELTVVEGAGHLLTESPEVVDEMLQFIRRTET
ncbi:MAG TPA: alpha/beta hydrolase [Xanthomonadales bacterium]|nr:alpha/beta hydrolase [Xanthomonadales bacterium]